VNGVFSCSVQAEFGGVLAAGLDPRDELVARLQWRHIDLVSRHIKL